MDGEARTAVLVTNARGRSPFVIVCDHASNRIPERYGDLGLAPSQRLSHIAWDPGALAVSRFLSDSLEAPLIESTVSRLVIDCNRALDAPDLITTRSENTVIAANENLGNEERRFRIAQFHRPFHGAIDMLLEARRNAGQETILVCMHSFTPVYFGVPRPWPIGLMHGRDARFTEKLREALAAERPDVNIGWNQPYQALTGVTLTLERHGDGRGIDSTMIEMRQDEVISPEGARRWAGLLARSLEAARLARRPAAAQ